MFKRKPSKDNSIEKAVKECALFQGLSNSELKTLLSISHIRDYSVDEKIFSEGTTGLCFYIIVKGSADIIREQSPQGSTAVLRTYTEGSFFAESHLFSETTHTVSCTAREVTKLIIFSKPDFEDLIKIKPKLGNKLLMKFLAYMSEEMEQLYKQNIKVQDKNPVRETLA
ncbi:MAG: cyclic nucleotide-binding domain-containing protein [Ignavibacteria bacterium]|jgi:CRP-like cAMP-binding protein